MIELKGSYLLENPPTLNINNSVTVEQFRAKTHMNKKLVISQSIMWAAAILVVSIVEEKEFAVLMLVLLATTALINLGKGQ